MRSKMAANWILRRAPKCELVSHSPHRQSPNLIPACLPLPCAPIDYAPTHLDPSTILHSAHHASATGTSIIVCATTFLRLGLKVA